VLSSTAAAGVLVIIGGEIRRSLAHRTADKLHDLKCSQCTFTVSWREGDPLPEDLRGASMPASEEGQPF
jgi:hypothetical protein